MIFPSRSPSLATTRFSVGMDAVPDYTSLGGRFCAGSPSGPTSGRTALRRVGRRRGRPRRPPPTCQRCTTCSRRGSTPSWSRTPTAGRPQCGCGRPSLLACTVVAVSWAFRTAPARAPRPRARKVHVHTPIHTHVHTIHTRVHSLVHTLFRSTCTHRPTTPPSWAPSRRESGERSPC